MHYDPVKITAGTLFNCCRQARVLFYMLLNILLLRSWYVRREIGRWEKEVAPNARVLDAGCGFGQYVHYVSRLKGKYRVKGIDVKEGEIDICRRFFGGRQSGNRISYEKADLSSLNESEKYDLVLCIDVLEHIDDDLLVMKNLFRCLKTGGMLIISTPSDQGGSDVHDKGDNSFIGEHVRDGYGKQEMAGKLSSAGFNRIDVHYSYGKPGQLSWKISMQYPLRMLNRGYIFFLILPFYYLLIMPFVLVLNYLDLRGEHERGTGLIVNAWKL